MQEYIKFWIAEGLVKLLWVGGFLVFVVALAILVGIVMWIRTNLEIKGYGRRGRQLWYDVLLQNNDSLRGRYHAVVGFGYTPTDEKKAMLYAALDELCKRGLVLHEDGQYRRGVLGDRWMEDQKKRGANGGRAV